MVGADRRLEALLFAAAALLLVLGFGAPAWRRPAFEPGSPAPGTLRLVTWNLGGSGPGGLAPLQDEDLPAIGAALRELAADLVALQEVESEEQAGRLARALGGRGASWLLARGGGWRVAVLARRGRLRPLELSIDEARVQGFEHEGRDGRLLRGVVLHADAFSAQERNLRIGEATSAALAVAEGLPLVVLGDLNLDLGLDERRDLFTDDEHLDVQTYNFVATRLVDAGLGAGPTAEPDRRLDYVFVDEERLDVERAGVWRGRRVGDMDHDPVVVDVRLRR